VQRLNYPPTAGGERTGHHHGDHGSGIFDLPLEKRSRHVTCLIFLPASTVTAKDDIFETFDAKGALLICTCGDRLPTTFLTSLNT
tara:strand:- start:291 stop:545 length:255 start_codon:yes stop_codon:yes gene_type:complete